MKSRSQLDRRRFLKAGAAAVPVVLIGGKVALAEDMPKLGADDPTGKALGYVENAENADKARFPNYSAEQKCSNCQLMTGDASEEWVPCSLFPGKLVAADGWCSAWVMKAG